MRMLLTNGSKLSKEIVGTGLPEQKGKWYFTRLH